MARLKRFCSAIDMVAGQPKRLSGPIRDGAIETPVCLRCSLGANSRLSGPIRDGAIETSFP